MLNGDSLKILKRRTQNKFGQKKRDKFSIFVLKFQILRHTKQICNPQCFVENVKLILKTFVQEKLIPSINEWDVDWTFTFAFFGVTMILKRHG